MTEIAVKRMTADIQPLKMLVGYSRLLNVPSSVLAKNEPGHKAWPYSDASFK